MNSKRIYKDEAIPLVQFDPEQAKYTVNNEAFEFIQSLPAPIGIVGVAGMYRTGKSYLLNRMILNRSDGFGVGPTVNPCTKGLWVWGRPLKGQTCDGEPCSILVVDSEGLGALDEDSTHDSRIFSLTILLSSCFIYNSVGSIDENAIQNLSLIVNLTKNIQIKSNPSPGQEVTYDDFSAYFPQFYWVVRDFTLQLVDQDGESISSREYLEKALQIQKGFSDHIEQKNRIRRLLQAFFKERDCITLVRPLTKEENLQNLEKLEFDKLRPEFFQQVVDLRKKIINRIKPKQMNGRNLSGTMYCDLVRSYVGAINQGAVPAIESAWNYICRNECQKSFGDAMESFELRMKELLSGRLPVSADDLKTLFKQAKETAIQTFHKRSVGEVKDEYLKELTRRTRARFQVIKQENEKEGLRACLKFIQKEFDPIEQKLKKGEYRNFQDIEQEIRLFYNYYMENGPKESQNRQAIVLDKMNRSLIEGGHLISKMLLHELEVLRVIQQDTNKKLEGDLREARAELMKERNNFSLQLKTLEKERQDILTSEQLLAQSLEDLRQQKQSMEAELRTEFSKEKNELQRQLIELKDKLINMEDSCKELERTALFGNSEAEKDKALSNQKLIFLERSLDEAQKKERDLLLEIKNQKLLHQQQVKEIQQKNDSNTYSLNQQINDLGEKLNEVENQLNEKEQIFDIELKRYESKERTQLKQNQDLQEQLATISKELRELRRNEDQWNSKQQSDNDAQSSALFEQNQTLVEQLRSKEEQLKQVRHQSEKEKAVLQQKMEFMELQLQENKSQMEENRRGHDAIMRLLESTQHETKSQVDATKINEIRDQHKKELRQLDQDHKNAIQKLQIQIETLTERNNELDLKVKFDTGDLLMEIDSLKTQLQESELTRNRLQEQNKNLDTMKHTMLREQEVRHQKKVHQLEEMVSSAEERIAQEVESVQAKAEEQLGQLKNFYELERERLEARLCEEQEKNKKRYQSATDEYYQKYKEQELQYEEDIESLKEELREQESTYQNLIQQLEHDKQIKQQHIENLESKIKDLKDQNLSLQNNHNASLEQQMSMFTGERKEMISKIESQTNQITKLQKDLMALEQRRDFLENEKLRKEVQLETLRKSQAEERRELFEKLDESKTKLQNLNDEYLEKKIEYGRELALVQQQNEFLQKKIDDLQRQLDTQQSRYEEKIKNQKQELQQEMNEKVERALEDRHQLEQKYEKIKKNNKETELSQNRLIATSEREKAILQEKLSSLEGKLSECELKLKEEQVLSQQALHSMKDQLSSDKRHLTFEVDKYKTLSTNLELERNELLLNQEKNQALWENKFHFLEQQRDQAKADLADSLRKFETTLDHLQKARNSEKEDQESNVANVVSTVQRDHQKQIDDLNAQHQRALQEYDERIRRLTKEIKQFKDQQLIDQHGKMGNQLLSEKKFAELLDNEKRLQQEVEQLKYDRDQKMMEYSKQFDVERDNLKSKITDLELRYKEIENKRSSLIFEFEKERAKWNLDKDHLMNLKGDLQDQLEKLERKKEFLLRENEKLKNEQRATRRSVNTANNMTSHTMLTANKYKPGGMNNVSTIGLSSRNHQLSPSHSSNTSTSSSNIGAHKLYNMESSVPHNLTDITNQQMKQPQPLYMLEDTHYQSSFLDIKQPLFEAESDFQPKY